jgi:diguanylate cyclase (GGDEF)-like protein/PAS domain S-box-containing protein
VSSEYHLWTPAHLTAEDEPHDAERKRLLRRFQRERKTRREAEMIAEQATRELYDRQAEVVLLERVAVAANLARSVEDAVQVAIDGVCAHTGWPVGHCLRIEGLPPELVSTGVWHLDDAPRFESFRRLTEGMRFPSGVGLPGRVLASGRPAWITDVTNDPNFPRKKAARENGLGAAFAFPILVGSEVVAVLEFLAAEALEPNQGLLGRMAQIGTQIGRVHERLRAQEEREQLGRRLEVLLESAGEGIYGVDANGVTTFVNRAAARMLGVAAGELIGRPIHEVVHAPHPGVDPHPLDDCPLNAPGRETSGSEKVADVFSRPDATSFPVEYVRTPLPGQGELSGAVLTFSDVTERRRIESQLQYLANHDALTGLLNRHSLEWELERMVAHSRRFGPDGAVLVLDLDSFKAVNDGLGHHAGDELIRAVGGRLHEQLRETDVLARLGGDEFAILLPRLHERGARTVAGRLVQALRGHTFAIAGHSVGVTASVGVAVLDETEVRSEELLMKADLAMYAAKEAGRDRLVVYTPEDARYVQKQAVVSWVGRIREALAEDRFVLHYQPILDLVLNEVSQFELLLRMQEDDGQLVMPGAFLGSAERFGLAPEIDRWVVRNAVHLLAELSSAAPENQLVAEINISGKSLRDGNLAALVTEELASTSVDPSRLVFEITETAAIANMDEALALAESLTALGCRFALDDFGAGFASFYYLKYLPLSYIKIDGEFIRNLPRSPIDQRMVRAMVEVAQGLGLKTIAEFVGDEETLHLLRELEVDFAQGYHLGKPRPVTELLASIGTASS